MNTGVLSVTMLLEDTVREAVIGSSAFPLPGIGLLLKDKRKSRSLLLVFKGLFLACMVASSLLARLYLTFMFYL